MTLTPAAGVGPRRRGKLAINQLRERGAVDEVAIDGFLARHEAPIVEGAKCTFLFRGEADEVHVQHRIVNQPQRVPMKRLHHTSLWWVTIELPEGSRVEYQISRTVGGHTEQFNDPLNPHVAHSPVGSSSVCHAAGYLTPEWVHHDPNARPGELHTVEFHSKALRRNTATRVYLPARYRASSA